MQITTHYLLDQDGNRIILMIWTNDEGDIYHATVDEGGTTFITYEQALNMLLLLHNE